MPKSGTIVVAAIGIGFAAVVGYLVMEAISAFGGSKADPDDAALVAMGRTVYAETCAACHGEKLEGEPRWRVRKADGTLPAPPHDESGHTWHHPDAYLFEVTKYGGAAAAPPGFKSAMPGFDDALSDRQIWAVLSYIKSRWPEGIRRRQETLNRRPR